MQLDLNINQEWVLQQALITRLFYCKESKNIDYFAKRFEETAELYKNLFNEDPNEMLEKIENSTGLEPSEIG